MAKSYPTREAHTAGAERSIANPSLPRMSKPTIITIFNRCLGTYLTTEIHPRPTCVFFHEFLNLLATFFYSLETCAG